MECKNALHVHELHFSFSKECNVCFILSLQLTYLDTKILDLCSKITFTIPYFSIKLSPVA